MHRSYHALPPLSNKKGEEVHGIYGSLLIFFRVISKFNPKYIVATFDLPGKTFRHKKYDKYKAHRPKTPPSLSFQIEKMKDVFSAFGVPVFQKKGYEADDLIGTLCSVAKKGTEAVIISGDLDTLQLVNDNVSVYALCRGVKDTITYGPQEVKERYDGITPQQLVDVKALKGDPSDNISGVEGVGEKTAVRLIKEFGSLDNLYSSIKEAETPSSLISEALREKLINGEEDAKMSKYLLLINKNVPIEFEIKDSIFKYDKDKVTAVLNEMGFQSLVKRLPEEKKRETGKLW